LRSKPSFDTPGAQRSPYPVGDASAHPLIARKTTPDSSGPAGEIGASSRIAYAAPASSNSSSPVVDSTPLPPRARPVRSWVKATPDRIQTAGASTTAYRMDL